MDLDLFTCARPSAEVAYDSELIKAEYIRKLHSGFYDNDASNPGNSVFRDSKLHQGVDPSIIIGSLELYDWL